MLDRFAALPLAVCLTVVSWLGFVSVFAQADVTGTWRIDGTGRPFPWEVVLRVDGDSVKGRLSSCTSPAVDIVDGRVSDDVVAFTCRSNAAGDRVIAFTGKIAGNQLRLAWALTMRPGAEPPSVANARLFGPNAPREIVLTRVADGDLADAFDQVSGVELNAAVNLRDRNLKLAGTLFIPATARAIRAVVVVPRYGRGEDFYNDRRLRPILAEERAALLLAGFSTMQTPVIFRPPNAEDGAADALQLLLRKLTEEASHPELAEAPLLFWGQSAGGTLGSSFAALYPDRTIAVVRYQSGAAGFSGERLWRVPTLVVLDDESTREGRDAVDKLFRAGRSAGAPWTFVLARGTKHGDLDDLKRDNELTIAWISAVLAIRVRTSGDRLVTLDDGSGWLGDIRSGVMEPAGPSTKSKPDTAWLPDERTAQAWRRLGGFAK